MDKQKDMQCRKKKKRHTITSAGKNEEQLEGSGTADENVKW